MLGLAVAVSSGTCRSKAISLTANCLFNRKREGLFCYLRFLYSLMPSMSCMYSNPFSISWVASLTLVAVLHVYWSSSSKWISCMYIIVVSIFLCPNCCLT